MQKRISKQKSKPSKNETLPEDRRYEDRRKAECEGYTYVPVVGWVCRRDQIRRENEENLK